MRTLNLHLMPFKEVFAYFWCKAILCELLKLNGSHSYEIASGICAKPWTQILPSHSHLVSGQSAKYLHLATVNTDCGICYAQIRSCMDSQRNEDELYFCVMKFDTLRTLIARLSTDAKITVSI